MQPTFITTRNSQEFERTGCDLLAKTIREAIMANGRAVIGLSGGSTPKSIYEALGKEKIDWSNVWIFLVDDRYIRADDPNSNHFLLRSTLLKSAAIPESQIIFPDTSLPLDQCIDLYDRHISDLLKKGMPDIVTLGMGDDGHIASLFPPLNDDAFGPSLVIHTTTDKFAIKDRISMTMPVIKRATQAVFFLKGIAKKDVWNEMVKSAENERRWPAKDLKNITVIANW